MDSMQRLIEDDVVARLAERDASLFADDVQARQPILQRMGWIDLALKAAERLAQYENIAEQVIAEGATDVVILGMGGSSLASLVFSEVFGSAPGHPTLHVLDTTSPITVSLLLSKLTPASTWFLVSSKSGTTIEPLSLYAIFRAWADDALGRPSAGRHFIVITDPGTPLEKQRQKDVMRIALPAPSNVGGRFSALTAFGLMPAALIGVDLPELIKHAEDMDRACRASGEDNPAAALAAWIADAHALGRDKLTLAASPHLASFPLWIEQLIAESTGKNGTGVVPVPETAMATPSGFGQDRAVVAIRSPGDKRLAAWTDEVRVEGHPVLEIEVADERHLGAEFVRWEYATAMLGFLLGINPFDEPDVGAAKQATLEVLVGADVMPALVDLDGVWFTYAGALREPETTPSDLEAALASAFAQLGPNDYLALLAYLPYDEARLTTLRAIVPTVASITSAAVCLEIGPRYLHSTGQLHKGGPDEGVFVVISARDREDVKVPGQAYSLARLHRAQAEGDLVTLAARGKRVMRVDLPDSEPATVERLALAIELAAGA